MESGFCHGFLPERYFTQFPERVNQALILKRVEKHCTLSYSNWKIEADMKKHAALTICLLGLLVAASGAAELEKGKEFLIRRQTFSEKHK